MQPKTRRSVFRYIVFVLVFSCIPVISLATVAVQLSLVSGSIVEKLANNAVKLDDGNVYIPSREDLAITIPAGEPVTLRYTVNSNGENIFVEFAPGMNSLQPIDFQKQATDRNPK